MAYSSATLDVSVIIRTKDRPILLGRALKSLAAQTSRNFEVIIVNDGGNVEPIEVLVNEYKLPEYIIASNEVSVGRPMAFNQALRMARGAFVACLDDDDTFEPRFIQDMTSFLRKAMTLDPLVGGLICRCTEIYEELKDNGGTNYLTFDDKVKYVERKILFEYNSAHEFVTPYFYFVGRENFLPVQTLFVRELALEKGGFAEANDVLEDRPLYSKILRDRKIAVLDEQLANHHTRLSKDGTTNSNSMHDNTSFNWGRRFAEFYNEGYYDTGDSQGFHFTLLRDALRDLKWDMTSDKALRIEFKTYWKNIFRLMRRNLVITILLITWWMLSMVAFSVVGGLIVKYWL
jgi:glycosyltransferase involved in cell wall biosynthesis